MTSRRSGPERPSMYRTEREGPRVFDLPPACPADVAYIGRMTPEIAESPSWPTGVTQLLDEHHLVVLAEQRERRAEFARGLAAHLEAMPDTAMVGLPGGDATTLDAFCRMLSEALHLAKPIPPNMDGLIRLLRTGPLQARHQYFIWHDADALLEADVRLFSRLVNAFLSVAAEFEYVNPDALTLQRMVFLGGDKLGAYAEDEAGQFCAWLTEGGSTRFWEVTSCVPRPPVLAYRLDG